MTPVPSQEAEVVLLRQELAQREEEVLLLRVEVERLRRARRPPIPQNAAAEATVVGSLLFAGRTFVQVADVLDPQDFYHPVLRAIYEAMVSLDEHGQPIDAITVHDQMRRLGTVGHLAGHGGEAYLIELASSIATIENIGHHAQLVRDQSTLRHLLHVGSEVQRLAYDVKAEPDRALEAAQQLIYAVAVRAQQQRRMEPGRAVLHRVLKSLEGRYLRKEAITGVPTGYEKFDEMTAGLQPGDLIIVAARPSMGKTALAMNIATFASFAHFPVLVFTLEMTKESLMERALGTEGSIESQRLRTGYLETRDWINVTKAAARLSSAALTLDDSGAPTLMEIRAKARRWRYDPQVFSTEAPGFGLIVVDYLQLIRGRGGKDTREREISDISSGLKALAKELGVPVVALSQLNRKCEERADKRPMGSDLRDSGGIEQDADVIVFVYRDEVYDRDSPDKGVAEIIIGKQRNGPTGTVRLAFLNQFARFANLAEGRS